MVEVVEAAAVVEVEEVVEEEEEGVVVVVVVVALRGEAVALQGVGGPKAEAGCQAVWRAASRGKAARWGALPAPVVLWGAWYLALAREAGCPRQWAWRWWAVCWWRRPGCHHRPPACRPAAWRPFP